MLDGAHYVSRIAEQEGKDAFFTDIKTQRAILYTLQTMSEASKGLSETTKAAEGDSPSDAPCASPSLSPFPYQGIRAGRRKLQHA